MIKHFISIAFLVILATTIWGQQTEYRKKFFFGVEYSNEEIVDSSNYLVKVAKLYEVIDDSLLLTHQILRPSRESSEYDITYYWSAVPVIPSNQTFVNDRNKKSKLDGVGILPYEANSYFGTDPIIKSPFTKVWTPLRRGVQYLDRNLGLTINPLVLTYFGYSPSVMDGRPSVSGFIGAEIYSNWLIVNTKKWGVTNITFELGYKQNITNENPDLGSSVGSNVTSNVTVSNSSPIIGDLYITQGFLKNKLLVSAGRITPWYFYAYNTFTDDELTRSFNSMLNGGTYLPEGGGNATKPGFGIRYLVNKKVYVNFVLTNPKGADAGFDFRVFDPDFHFLASEIGYVYSFKNQLEGRLSFGAHHGLKRNFTDQNNYNGWGYTLLVQQELTPKGYTPYIGIYIQAAYSDSTISSVKQQYSLGLNIDHFVHRRNDGIGVGMGVTKPSNIMQRTEFFMDMFYRLQLTQSSQLTLDVQLFVNPSNPAQNRSLPSIFSLRYLFSI